MDPKLVYWTLALANLGTIAGCLLAGVLRIRGRDVRGHRRRMLTAAALAAGAVAGFCPWRFRARLGGGAPLPSPMRALRVRRVHRRAGRTAVVGCLLAFVTASFVLAGMYARAWA